jgi:hypothetical protein
MENSPPPTPTTGSPPRWQEIIIVLAVVAGLALTALFSFRLYRSIVTMRHNRLGPGATDVSLIQGWMTVPYISKAYRIPEQTLWQDLAIPARGNRIKNLYLLDRDYAGGKTGVILNRVKSIVQAYQSLPPPTPPPLNPTQTAHP